jgi:hypothetical protein
MNKWEAAGALGSGAKKASGGGAKKKYGALTTANPNNKWAAAMGGGDSSESKGGGGGGIIGAPVRLLGKAASSRPVAGALNALTMFGAATTATVRGIDDLTEGRGLSASKFLERFNNRETVGEWIEESRPDAPHLLKVLGGFAGDVALDPLTYLTGGTVAAGKGATAGIKAGQRLPFAQAADQVAKTGARDTAESILRARTAGTLGKSQLDELGLRQGLHFGIGKAKLTVPGSHVVSKGRAAATTPLVGRFLSSKVGTALDDVFNDKLINGVKRQDPVAARDMIAKKRAMKATERSMRSGGIETLDQLAKTYKDVDTAAVARRMEDPSAVVGPREAAAAKDLAALFERLRVRGEAVSGRTIPRLEDYLPRQLTDDFMAMVFAEGGTIRSARNGRPSAQRQAFENQRTTRVGRMWFGEVLTEDTATVAGMEAIAKAALGDKYVQVFQNDPFKLAHSYIRSISAMASSHRFAKDLEDLGYIKYLQDDEQSLKALERLAGQRADSAARMGDEAVDLAAEADDALAQADALRGTPGQVDPQKSALAGVMGTQGDRAAANAAGWEDSIKALVDEQDALKGAAVDTSAAGKVAAAEDKLAKQQGKLAELDERLKALGPEPQAAAPTPKTVPKSADVPAPKAPKLKRVRPSEAMNETDVAAQDAIANKKIEALLEGHDPVFVAPDVVDNNALRVTLNSAEKGSLEDAAKAADMLASTQPRRTENIEELLEAIDGAKAGSEKRALREELRAEIAMARKAILDDADAVAKAQKEAAVDAAALPPAVRKEVVELQRQIKSRSTKLARRLEREAAKLQGIAEANAKATAKYEADLAAWELGAKRIDDVASAAEAVPAAGRDAWQKKTNTLMAQREKTLKQVQAGQAEVDHMRAQFKDFERIGVANQARLDEIDDLLVDASEQQGVWLTAERTYRAEAERLTAAALDEADVDLAQIARLEATAASASADAAQRQVRSSELDNLVKAMRVPARQAEFHQMMNDGLRTHLAFDPQRYADPEVAKLVDEVMTWNTPQNIPKIIKYMDTATARWKAYALLSGGYHVRNYYGGQFQNSLAGVDLDSQIKFVKAVVQSRKGIGNISDLEVRRAFQAMEDLKIFGEHNIRDMADIQISGSAQGVYNAVRQRRGNAPSKLAESLDPTSLNNAALKLNQKGAGQVEKMLRGPLFLDRMLKGFDPEQAMADVYKYHFDYSELSKFESDVMKRVIPFYTWMRKNVPLQLEHMLAKPGKYTKYTHLKRNLELGTEEDPFRPEYYDDDMAIKLSPKLPFVNGMGGSKYLVLDTPFTRLEQSLNVNDLLASVTPFVKMPVELAANKSFFSGQPIEPSWAEAAEAPAAWKPLMPILEQFGGTMGMPKVERGPNGEYLINRKAAYKIEQVWPLMGRLRRLGPSEQHLQDRHMTSILSIVFGVGTRTLTDEQAKLEQQRRQG